MGAKVTVTTPSRKKADRSPLAQVGVKCGRTGGLGPVDAPLKALVSRPAFTSLCAAHRRLATVAVSTFVVWLFVHVVLGPNGIAVYSQKKAMYVRLRNEIDALEKENDRTAEQIEALRDEHNPKAIEKEAREQLHYARPGEVIFVHPETVPPKNTPRN